MKAVMIHYQIINCEEIRNVYIAPGGSIRIFFKNHKGKDYDSSIDIPCKNVEERKEILTILFEEMSSEN